MRTAPTPLADARTFLFVPGNRPERFDKAVKSGADAVVFDLEDAVPPAEKESARASIDDAWPALRNAGVPLVIRINTPAEPQGREDLRWLARLEAPAGIMVPKADSGAMLGAVLSSAPGAAILPLIESAAAYGSLADIAAAQGVLRLVVGHIDFQADTGMGCSEDQAELAPLRFAVSVATRCHGLAPAVDGVTVSIDDDDALRRDTRRALRFGFGGKLCIHPRQVAVVHQAMQPGHDELAWARRVLEADAASAGAAVRLDGKMVDAPVVLQARRTLARAGR
ncbi:CoA ester lyase [Pigmentiphaga soli]|uniref:CoA ester lyase n=1 Tax=Pigmentiphaga soli TaxID=1007095 RepID=A0ABP8HKH7_9BURK